MQVKRRLSSVEVKVLDLLPEGEDHPIQLRMLVDITGFSTRKIYDIINGLVTKAGVPIVSKRNGDVEQRGYYIATSDEERAAGLVGITEQTKDMEQRIKAVKNADLSEWKKNIIKPGVKVNTCKSVG